MSTKLTKRVFITILPLIFIFINCSKEKSTNPIDPTKCQMVVYPNSGNKLTIVNYNKIEIVKQIILDIPDSLQIHRMCISTNKDYFIFCASTGVPPFSNHIITYNIENDSVYTIFSTGLDSVGAPRLTASYIPDKPGLVYLYSHNVGLYSIDFFTKDVNNISSECGLPKEFYHSPDEKWIVIKKYLPGYDNDYTEIEFYNTLDGLYQPDFILNKKDRDSLDVIDLVFSDNNTKLYISYLLSQRRAVYKAAYFGSYNLKTKRFNSSSVSLPWSVNPYYIAYSSKHNEAYMVGAQDKFYVIDLNKEDYVIKTVINLTGKIPSPSRIFIRPDENVAFVSCVNSNFVIAIDLNKKSILKKIPIESPYLMVLL